MKSLKLIYSKEFLDDLLETVDFIKEDNYRASKIFENNVRKRIKQLKKFPEMGKKADDSRLFGIRILIIGNYLVLYEVDYNKNSIYLHGFCHGARDYPNLFKKINYK